MTARYQEALAQSRHIHDSLSVLRSCERLGRVALALNDPETAAGHYRPALDLAVETHHLLLLPEDVLRLDLVAGMAVLLASGDGERAVELAALSRHRPSSAEETRGRAQEILDGLRAKLPAAAKAAAEERGRSRDLVATLRELIEVLGGEDTFAP